MIDYYSVLCFMTQSVAINMSKIGRRLNHLYIDYNPLYTNANANNVHSILLDQDEITAVQLSLYIEEAVLHTPTTVLHCLLHAYLIGSCIMQLALAR